LATAVAGLATATVKLLIELRRSREKHGEDLRRIVAEKDSEIVRLRKNIENLIVETRRKERQRLEELISVLCPPNDVGFVRAVTNLYFAEEPLDVCRVCGRLRDILEDDPIPNWPWVLRGTARILAGKCKSAREPASREAAFRALGKMCAKLLEHGQSEDIETVSGAFEELLAPNAPESVKANAIIELTSLCQKCGCRTARGLTRIGRMLTDILDRLKECALRGTWIPDTERQAKAAIASLRFFRGAPDILNGLLPGILSLVDSYVGAMVETFAKLLETLDLNALDGGVCDAIYRHAEDVWLKANPTDCDDRLKETVVVAIIRMVRLGRPVRTNRRPKMPRVVEMGCPGTEKVLVGKGLDVDPGGFCVEVTGMLVGERFQTRRPGGPPFEISEGGLYLAGQADLSIRDSSGANYSVKGERVDTLRAWRCQEDKEGRPRTGLAGMVHSPTAAWQQMLTQL
jgi:hypothetical protein